MSNPKKKLPTGPIRITHPGLLVEKNIQESNILESRKQDSTKQETGMLEALIPEVIKASDSLFKDNRQTEVTEIKLKQDSGKQESRFLQKGYKKVAMRLSETGVARLRNFRADTGLPYEILVDVMICNFDRLPSEIRKEYLSQIRQTRLERLVAGQNKGLETAKQKLSDLD